MIMQMWLHFFLIKKNKKGSNRQKDFTIEQIGRNSVTIFDDFKGLFLSESLFKKRVSTALTRNIYNTNSYYEINMRWLGL